MFVARLVCSDSACAEAFEARASTLGELEALACACGCALQILGWPDALGGRAGALDLVLLA
ncbi:MAG: hypothetical protein QOD81_3253 [Solirubrobacteraceae bacterium]|nr:hypothetical protein [Solirubrobacteraceae bacterium]